MRFFIHGQILPAAQAALVKHGHHCQTELDLGPSAEGDVVDASDASPADLLEALTVQQWNLITTDPELIHQIYDQKLAFSGSIVFLLEALGQDKEQAEAIDRLFERYKRLTAKRLYTVTPSRIKIRQLPGAGAE